MADKLETFIDQHLKEFDTIDLPKDIWLKIDTRMEAKSVRAAKSKRLSRLIYFFLSVAVLVISVIYFIAQKSDNTFLITSNEKSKELILKSSDTLTNISNDHLTEKDLMQVSTSHNSILKNNVNTTNLKHLSSNDSKKDIMFSNMPSQKPSHGDSCKITEIYQTYPNKIFWRTKNEVSKLPFIAEQFHWNKWIKVGKVPCKGKHEGYKYMINVLLYSGENIFRIVQINDSNIYVTISGEIKWMSDKPKVEYTIKKMAKKIHFSVPTNYEILDIKGTVVKEGEGKTVSYKNLPEGTYVLNYDNYIVTFKR